jgi:hypothetical protein
MKNLLLTITLICYAISNGQYISEGIIKFTDKKDELTIKAEDIVYLNDKFIQFRNVEYPYVLSFAKTKHISKIDFDTLNYSIEVPELPQTFMNKFEYKGTFPSFSDIYANNITDSKVRVKNLGYMYEFESDLIDVVNPENLKRIKDISGLIHNGDLYISVRNMWENENENNKNYVLMHEKNTFVRIKYMNDEFMYLEMPLKGMGNFILSTALGNFGAIGGLGAALVSTKMPENYRPIFIYKENNEVFVIKDCEQFNEHLEKKNKSVKIEDCKMDYNLNTIRDFVINKM